LKYEPIPPTLIVEFLRTPCEICGLLFETVEIKEEHKNYIISNINALEDRLIISVNVFDIKNELFYVYSIIFYSFFLYYQ